MQPERRKLLTQHCKSFTSVQHEASSERTAVNVHHLEAFHGITKKRQNTFLKKNRQRQQTIKIKLKKIVQTFYFTLFLDEYILKIEKKRAQCLYY
jgi:transposase-like protein